MNDQVTTSPLLLTVVHRSLPGPWSADPRDRQVHRRILDLVALGHVVTLVPIESQLPGGAPGTLRAAGVRIDAGPRETASQRVRRLAATTDVWYLTEPDITRALLDCLLDVDGDLVVDIEHLGSTRLTESTEAMRADTLDGLSTEIADVRSLERTLLGRATIVVCSSKRAATEVHQIGGSSVPTTVVPPTAPIVGDAERTLATTRAQPGHLIVPGRFTDEFGTPDETVLRRLLTRPGRPPLTVVAEDAVPHLRRDLDAGFTIGARRDAWATTLLATAAIDVRPYGSATTARRSDLCAAGVPFVASTVSLGDDELPGVAADLVSDDLDEQLELLVRLHDDPALRDATARDLLDAAERGAPATTRKLLRAALDSVGIGRGAPSVDVDALVERHGPGPGEYRMVDLGGTLADADPRIARLEQTMIPVRLHGREDSINLQSTMDADQRYRIYARTHLQAGPAAAPPTSATTEALRISVLVPTWNTDPALLAECVRSVRDQLHQNWELCIVDDGSTEVEHLELLHRWAAEDDRIKVRCNPYNQGIALATNDALAMATGDWIALLDHDDVLKPDALAWVAAYVDHCPDYDLWYSDEDKISQDGQLVMPFFKPDWSPELVMGVNYVCHLLCMRRSLIDAVDGYRAGFDGAQDYDLVLRMVERARRVGHIAKPLYSWRMVEGSTALDTGSKPKAHFAGHQALQDAVDRRGEPARIEDGAFDTTHVVRYSVDTEQLLTIMVPTRDRVDLLRDCVDRLELATGGVRYELLIIDNQTRDPETLEYLDGLVAAGHQVVRYPHDFSFARQINLGALHARGDLVLILNNDALARNGDWLIRMMEHAQRPEVGLVGARLMFPPDQRDGRPQHEGIVMGMAGLAYNIDLGGYMGLDQFVRNCSAVTAACVMMRTSVLRLVNGMEERLRVAYNDVDMGLRISELGYRVVYTPHAVLEHPESASRGSMHPMDDEEWLIDRWGTKGAVREPYISPHFEWMMPVFYRL